MIQIRKSILCIILFMFIVTVDAAPTLKNSGGGNWQNYIDITIKENSGGNLTDYQIPVLLSGGNFPPDVRSDGADIRFIDAGEDELNFWIEKWDYENRAARIWVKVSRINANSEANIRMYYGNPSATSASNGEGTFEFFDDFRGAGIDQTKWHINYGTPVVSDGVLSLSGENIVSERTRAFGYNYIFESLSKMSDTGNEPKSFLRSTNDYAVPDVDERFEFGSWTSINEMSFVNVNDGKFNIQTIAEKFPISFEVLGIARSKTKSELKSEAFRQYVIKKINQNNIPNEPLFLQLYSWGGETHYIDWARIRKYAQPGPSVNVELQPLPQSPCKSSASVSLHGEKTDVELGEDILLKLSAVNLITNPVMHVQVILIPPSGMSVSSSEFVMSGTGQYTSTFNMEPGMGRDIEVRIRSNQEGNFEVKGRIIYYFGDDKDKSEDCTLNQAITVRKGSAPTQNQTQAPNPNPSIAGFEAIISMIGILLVSFLRKKW